MAIAVKLFLFIFQPPIYSSYIHNNEGYHITSN